MAAAILEAHHLVFDGWAIARADALDLARIHRRAMDIRRDNRMRLGGGIGDVARDLRNRDPIIQK